MLQNQLKDISCKCFLQASAVAVVATTLLLLGASSGYADFAYETFDTGLGTWTTESSYNHIEGFDIGWSSTGNASGVGGEVGGTFAKIDKKGSGPTAPKMAHILDTNSFAGGKMVSLNMPLSASGRMILYDSGTADCTVYVGFFKNGPLTLPPGYPTVYDAGSERLILRITGPQSSNRWRFNFGGPDTTQGPTRVTVPDSTWSDTPLDFNFTWTPSGLNNGSGTVSGYVQKAGGGEVLTVPSWAIGPNLWNPVYGQNLYNFDSFGIWADSSNETDITRTHVEWFDNLQYTVLPAPALSAVQSGADVILSWPSPSSGYFLEETPSLSPPTWTTNKVVPSDNGTIKSITLTPTAGNRFYRLKWPKLP